MKELHSVLPRLDHFDPPFGSIFQRALGSAELSWEQLFDRGWAGSIGLCYRVEEFEFLGSSDRIARDGAMLKYGIDAWQSICGIAEKLARSDYRCVLCADEEPWEEHGFLWPFLWLESPAAPAKSVRPTIPAFTPFARYIERLCNGLPACGDAIVRELGSAEVHRIYIDFPVEPDKLRRSLE